MDITGFFKDSRLQVILRKQKAKEALFEALIDRFENLGGTILKRKSMKFWRQSITTTRFCAATWLTLAAWGGTLMASITGGQKRKIDFMAFKITTWWSFFTFF